MTLKRLVQITLAVMISVGTGLALRPENPCTPASLDRVLTGGKLLLPENCVIMLDSPRVITGTVEIQGGMLHSGGINRILEVAPTGRLTLNNVRVLSGAAEGGDGIGGGILNYGYAFLYRVRVSANSASQGGGVYNAEGATLRLEFSSIERNIAKEAGGGIFNKGNLIIIASYVSGNRANYGAGIENKSEMSLHRATIINNRALLSGDYGGYAGGISNKGSATITDTRISNNRAQLEGAGIDNNGEMTIHNSVIVNNICEDNCLGTGIFVFRGTVDARENYWGTPAGPTADVIHNLPAKAYTPWLKDLPDWAD